jgi:hypothetical protein
MSIESPVSDYSKFDVHVVGEARRHCEDVVGPSLDKELLP